MLIAANVPIRKSSRGDKGKKNVHQLLDRGLDCRWVPCGEAGRPRVHDGSDLGNHKGLESACDLNWSGQEQRPDEAREEIFDGWIGRWTGTPVPFRSCDRLVGDS